jgi:hypothetical protein
VLNKLKNAITDAHIVKFNTPNKRAGILEPVACGSMPQRIQAEAICAAAKTITSARHFNVLLLKYLALTIRRIKKATKRRVEVIIAYASLASVSAGDVEEIG